MTRRVPPRHSHVPAACTRRRFLAASLAAGVAIPRFLTAAQSSGAGEVPWLAEVQKPPERLPADAPTLAPLLVDERGQPVSTLAAWQQRRAQIRQWWLEFLGPLPGLFDKTTGARSNVRPPPLQVTAEERVEGVIRQLVRYETEPGITVEAYLLKPAPIEGRRPGLIVLHSTTTQTIRQPAGLAGEPTKTFGLKWAQRGGVALCPRCFLWTEDLSIRYDEHVRRFQERHPGCRGMAKMLLDSVVAVDVLAGLPFVDPQRLGAVGHSLGGKEVLYLAAFDERIRAAVSSEGGVGTRFSNWDASWYLGPEIRRDEFRHEHHELVALIAPRAFLLLGGDSADGDRSWPFIAAGLPIYRLSGGTARVGLLNHKQGHNVPAEVEPKIYEWLQVYG